MNSNNMKRMYTILSEEEIEEEDVTFDDLEHACERAMERAKEDGVDILYICQIVPIKVVKNRPQVCDL